MMTESMVRGLVCMMFNGAVFAGANVIRGSKWNVPASTVRALAARGFCKLQIGPDGGMMGVPA